MSEQNLNPDALHAAWESNNGYTEGIRMGDVERMVTAYLSALPAQPDTVNSVEELDQLPARTVIRDRVGDVFEKDPNALGDPTGDLYMPGVEGSFPRYVPELPSTVLYRPVE